MAPRPPLVLDAPAPVAPRRAGLFLAATGPMDMPAHAVDVGAQWWTDACGNARLFPAGCMDTPYSPYLLDAAGGMEYAYPFNIYATTVCPPVGVDAEESRQRVLRRLQKAEQRAFERAFWGGQALIDNPPAQVDTPVIKGLVQLLSEESPVAGITLLAGTAATAKEALSRLEQAAADSPYDGPVLIHARKGVAAYTSGLHRTRLSSDGEHQYTHAGSEWVFGDGYAGTSPDNATPPDATTEYMVATGRVYLWRGSDADVMVSEPDQILDKTTNQRGMIAIRPAAIGVDCWAAAVKFTRA